MMENDEEVAIEKVFEEEIGVNIDKAIEILREGGISAEDLGNIANMFKKEITYEVERRSIPYEYRFLLLNVVLCTMFKATATFHKKFMKAL
jgi:predicted HTH domain antitoxin